MAHYKSTGRRLGVAFRLTFGVLAVLQIAFSDPEWLIGDQIRTTGYLFAALIFWSLCFSLSRYSARLDRSMASRANAKAA